ARVVRVALSGSGLSAITVSDDGFGMSRRDATLALSRHATSKLRDLDGLFEIATLGFRGEALPAIASVSRFTLVTSEPSAPAGTRIGVEGGGCAVVEDAAPVGGTRIEVADLFFNTPARRKFMRRDQTELSHCHEAVVRLALSHPEAGFFLEHEGRSLLSSPPCGEDLKERIASALGPEVHAHLLPVEERRLGVSVTGFVASPELTFPTARGLYAFVNRRFIRDRGVNHAILRAFRESLPPGRQPVAVLFIEVDPRAVDVNVHPQKLEVRFGDARGVHDAVVTAVERALKSSPWLTPAQPSGGEAVPGAHYAQAVEQFLARAQAPLLGEAPLPFAARPGFGTQRPGVNEAPPPGFFGALRPLGPLAGRYLVCEGAGGSLVVLDPHAALERACFDALRRALEAGAAPAQPSLFSATVELTSGEAAALARHGETLARVGVLVEGFGGGTLAVRALPASLLSAALPRLFADLALALPPAEPEAPLLAAFAPALKVLACHAAGGGLRELSSSEAASLFQALDRADFTVPCAHGRVVLAELPLLELERRAGDGRRPEN
ncbi:MAG: DNA mismatch repair endonuclease MutL, partial [Myxococcaceae bacterium]